MDHKAKKMYHGPQSKKKMPWTTNKNKTIDYKIKNAMDYKTYNSMDYKMKNTMGYKPKKYHGLQNTMDCKIKTILGTTKLKIIMDYKIKKIPWTTK